MREANVALAIKVFRATATQRGRVAEDFKKNNPSVTLSRATSLKWEAKVTFAIKAFLATVCHRGRVAEDFSKNNPSVTASRATSLCTKEAVSCVCFKRDTM